MQRFTTLLLAIIVLNTTSCEKNNSNSPASANLSQPFEIEKDLSSTIDSFTANMFASGASAIKSTQAQANNLNKAVDTFLDDPTQEKLISAQKHWLDAAIAYREFYFYRQISEIDSKTFSDVNKLDNYIAGFPIQPGVLDKFGQYQYSGLVHDIGIPIDEISLTEHHGLTDITEVILGLHAIEFLLFNSGEERDVSDFKRINQLTETYRERGFKNIKEIPNNRRRQLLAMQSKILISDLKKLENNWLNEEKGSVRDLWKKIYFGRMTGLANQSIAIGLSEIMLEIVELAQDKVETPNVPETIKSQGFELRQQFIGNALKSIQSNTHFFSHDKKAKLNQHLSSAIEMTTKDSLIDGESEQAYWKTLFSQVKDASVIAMR